MAWVHIFVAFEKPKEVYFDSLLEEFVNAKYGIRCMGLGLLLVGGWMGCSKTQPTSAPSSHSESERKIVAKLGEAILKEDELNVDPEVSQARSAAAAEWVRKTLIGQLIKEKGKSSEAELRASVTGSVPPVTEDEAKKIFETEQQRPNSPLAGKSFELFKDKVIFALTQERREEAFEEWLEKEQAARHAMVQVEEAIYSNIPTDGPSKGPQDAKVTIVEFSDFQCPFCSKARQTMEEVLKKYDGKVRLVFRDFPLDFHDKAQKAAEAGQCAHKQGKFWSMHDWMFDHQNALEVDSLKQAAKELGLDKDKFAACLDARDTKDIVKKSLDMGQKFNVKGTPAFFVNGRFLSGAQPLSKFAEKIDQILATK